MLLIVSVISSGCHAVQEVYYNAGELDQPCNFRSDFKLLELLMYTS